jgi:plastocyanin
VLSRGTSLGRYVVLEVLGVGGQGVVYGAYDPQLDRKVALKLVRVRDGGDASDDQRARLLHEAQVLARLSHPNVVMVHDVGRFADQLFIAMEFMAGGTLAAWLETKPPVDAVLERFREAGREPAAARAEGAIEVRQKGQQFSPAEVTVPVGRAITFINDDDVAHSVISKDGRIELPVQRPGERAPMTFDTPGTVEVRCAIHPGMKLKVKVK